MIIAACEKSEQCSSTNLLRGDRLAPFPTVLIAASIALQSNCKQYKLQHIW